MRLHFAGIEKLIALMQRLVNASGAVLVIEHNLEVSKTADYVIATGPEGCDKGGGATGTLEQINEVAARHAGRYLKKILDSGALLAVK